MVVKNEQIAPIIHCRRTMFPHNPAAQFPTHDISIRLHYTERCPRFGCSSDCGQDPILRIVSGQHTQRSVFFTIHPKGLITAMRKEILELDSPSGRDSRTTQRFIKPTVISLNRMFHEDLPDNIIYERRMNAVSTEIAGPRQASQHLGDHRNTTGAFIQESFHRLSMPANRPVEKAICKLYPPVFASRSNTSPAK